MKWTKNVNFSLNPDSPIDSKAVLTPKVIKLPRGGYRMFYMGASLESSGRILSAFSRDLENWHKEPSIRIDNDKSEEIDRVLSPDIIKISENFWRMYYEVHLTNKSRVIMSAISEDLDDWSVESGTRIKSKYFDYGTPKCIKLDDGNFRLFFYSYPKPFKEGINARNHIISAKSCDGIGFQIETGGRIAQDNDEFENYTVYAPEVIKKKDESWLMYFSGWTWDQREGTKGRIFSASSNDSFRWYKDKSVVIDNGGLYDYRFASEPCLIDSGGGKFVMFYEACDFNGVKRIVKADQDFKN